MSPTLLDLSLAALTGIALTGMVLNFAMPRAYIAPAGEPGIPLEIALGRDADTQQHARFGGNKAAQDKDPAWASFPRAF